jgi:hypothetical protein
MSMVLAKTKGTITHLEMNDLYPAHLNEDFDSIQQISAHLRQQLERCGTGNPPTIGLPSAMELSYFYERNVLDVLDALFELKKQQYEYSINGLDAEILLWDPTSRRRRAVHNPWHTLIIPVNALTHMHNMLFKPTA